MERPGARPRRRYAPRSRPARLRARARSRSRGRPRLPAEAASAAWTPLERHDRDRWRALLQTLALDRSGDGRRLLLGHEGLGGLRERGVFVRERGLSSSGSGARVRTGTISSATLTPCRRDLPRGRAHTGSTLRRPPLCADSDVRRGRRMQRWEAGGEDAARGLGLRGEVVEHDARELVRQQVRIEAQRPRADRRLLASPSSQPLRSRDAPPRPSRDAPLPPARAPRAPPRRGQRGPLLPSRDAPLRPSPARDAPLRRGQRAPLLLSRDAPLRPSPARDAPLLPSRDAPLLRQRAFFLRETLRFRLLARYTLRFGEGNALRFFLRETLRFFLRETLRFSLLARYTLRFGEGNALRFFLRETLRFGLLARNPLGLFLRETLRFRLLARDPFRFEALRFRLLASDPLCFFLRETLRFSLLASERALLLPSRDAPLLPSRDAPLRPSRARPAPLLPSRDAPLQPSRAQRAPLRAAPLLPSRDAPLRCARALSSLLARDAVLFFLRLSRRSASFADARARCPSSVSSSTFSKATRFSSARRACSSPLAARCRRR